jgi:hypothetical protein
MIPAETLTPKEFAKRYRPGGRSIGARSPKNIKGEDIINDIPTNAKSCRVYNVQVLRKFRGDDTYPIPQGDELYQSRELKSLEAVVKEISPGKSVFSHMFVSPQDVLATFEEDFVEEMKAIQRDVNQICGLWLTEKIIGLGSFKKPFETYSCLKPNRDGHSSYTLAGTVQSNPVILSPVAHSTERSRPDNDGEDDLVPLFQSLNRRTATLGARVVEKLFPSMTSRLQWNRRTLLDPPMFGSEKNHSFSTLQINISPLTKRDLSSSLGYARRSHIDRHDDPFSLTVLICLSYLNPNTDPGDFYMGETRERSKLKPFSLGIFRGTGPHGGTQAIAPGEPGELDKRINLILYPRREFVNRTVDILYPCYSQQQLADYSFFIDGAACFGSEEYYKAWCRRELLRHMIALNKKCGIPLKDSQVQLAFKAITGTADRYIDPESPEGLGIRNSIAHANQIMESVRPSWVDPKRAHPPATESPNRTSRKRPAEDSSTTVSTIPIKLVRIESQTTSEPRRSSRLTGSSATTHQHTTASQETGPSQSSKRKKATASTSRRNVNIPEPVTDLIDNPRLPGVGISPSSNSMSVVELLQSQPLFQLSTMKEQIGSIRTKAKHLPSKLTKRSPQTRTAAKGSALPPPKTNGTVIVESLLQLAEDVQWLTQKSEHIWFYQCALDELYAHKLLQVGPLFDHDRLVDIFKNSNRNEGAGFCSRAVMDKVVLMVNKMMEMGDKEEGIMTFDPKELFGNQYQKKFCGTVEAKMRPFRGRNPYAHMAQHFREVIPTFLFEV